MAKPKIIVFASGTKDGGGSGFENLVKSPELDAEIVAVVSNHEHGGVRTRAEKLGIRFVHFDPGNYSQILKNIGMDSSSKVLKNIGTYSVSDAYRLVLEQTKADWVALSGWLKKVEGLDPARAFNIHPALLSFDNCRFGGPGLYGHHVHEAVKKALDAGEITESGVTMHFVTPDYDRGPIFFEYRVPLEKGMSADEIGSAVNKAEHQWQPKITNLVVHGEISWDGKDPKSLVVPIGYEYLPRD